MKDFGQWLADQGKKTAEKSHIELFEEAGVIRGDKSVGYEAKCVKCDQWRELYCNPSEIDETYEHYCGGSPHCCP
ncbi:hypothetical protein ACPCHQ_11865 [Ralstonia thomasii]|jgi:hypothetical protein|uniref:Uncharacterized protein n=2 Tax=Ralstonia TaxID=48736 RepID=A0ABN9IT35_9RALS|nr:MULTISPECIES: hypothetical protein [Ralstonia]MBT2177737.1 hypothetical protein [Ralstonia pickettii]CAJ0710586.1 hypothetical protein LMG7143_01634 [Ralstonia sp. LMG 18095]CAJ0792245.1 hypothetical protein LMG18095_02288 [Ralstonia sp. LMG 18095]